MRLTCSIALNLASLLFFRTLLAQSPVAPASPSPSPAHSASPLPSATPRISYNSVHVSDHQIAMTFDDGPSDKLTPKLLDLLAERHIKATFFVIGQSVAEHPEIVQRASREGHEIGNHSWSHPNLGKMSDEAVRRELRKTDDAIFAAIGHHPALMRPPYGSLTARQRKWIHEEFGYRIILWEVDPLDWKRPGPSVVEHRIVANTRAGDIVLAHDIHPGTVDAMPGTFTALAQKGFKFETVSKLLAMATPVPPKAAPTAPKAGAVPNPAAAAPSPASAPAGQPPTAPAAPASPNG